MSTRLNALDGYFRVLAKMKVLHLGNLYGSDGTHLGLHCFVGGKQYMRSIFRWWLEDL